MTRLLQKSLIFAALLLTSPLDAWAQTPDPANDLHTTIIADYVENLELIQNGSAEQQQAHCDALVAQLSQISGLPIIEDYFNDIWTVVVWDGSLGDTGGVAIYQNDTVLNVELGWDEMCRPTFAGPGYTGWIDVYDGRVHIGLEFADPTQIPGAWGSEFGNEWRIAEIKDEGDGEFEVETVAKKICSCNGTGETGGCDLQASCTNVDPCTLNNGTQSTCKWGNKKRVTNDCGSVSAASAGGILIPLTAVAAIRRYRRRRRKH